MTTHYQDKVGELISKTKNDLDLMNMIVTNGFEDDVSETSLLKSLVNKAHWNIKNLSHEIALKTVEEYCSPIDYPNDILKGNDKSLLAQRSKVSFEKNENKQTNFNIPRENDQIDAIDLYPLKHLSPGEKFKLENALKILSDPSHPFNHQTVQNAYGIQLPTILQTQITEEKQQQQRKLQETTNHSKVELTTVKKKNKNKNLKLIQYDETSDSCNALNLIQRGLIPTNAQLIFDPSPMQTKSINLATSNQKALRQPISINDLCPIYEPATNNVTNSNSVIRKKEVHSGLSTLKSSTVHDVNKRSRNVESVFITETSNLSKRQTSSKAAPPPCTPITTSSLNRNFWLTTEEGIFQSQSEDYQAFEEQFKEDWDKISTLLCELENLFDFYGISVAVVNGVKLVKLTKEYENSLPSLTSDILLTCVEDSQTIRRIMNEPGSSFRGRHGTTRAAIKIQSIFRRFRAQKQYAEQKRLRGAAAIISTAWIRYKKLKWLRERLSDTRKYCTEISQKKLKELGNNWEHFEQNNHVLIHLPSASYSETIRQQLSSIKELEYMESRQIARICEVRNPNTDVVIVTRAPISDDILEYYNKLLGLTKAIETGHVEDQCSINSRYRIIVPEAVKYFHSDASSPMCLASLLKYSPRALKHIRYFIAKRPALLIPSSGEHDDVFYVANYLQIPVFSALPSINALFTLQSTTKRLINQLIDIINDNNTNNSNNNNNNDTHRNNPSNIHLSKVSMLFTSVITNRKNPSNELHLNKLVNNVDKLKNKLIIKQNYWKIEQPPNDFDIYTIDYLHETLASLFTENLPIKNWLLKIDHNNIDKCSTAIVSIDNLQSFKWALEQRQWHGASRWNKKWAQENTYVKILSEVPNLLQKHLKLFSNSFYTDSESFLQAFLKHGGVIEACPPVDEWTNLSVVIVILPNKTIRIVASGDHLHLDDKFHTWGETIPMTSVSPLWVNYLCIELGSLMANKGVVGYVNIDFLTFIHPEKIIAKPTTSLKNNNVKLQETTISDEKYTEKDRNKLKRYAVVSSRLQHSNLTMIQYSVFFKICRANYIGYDLKERQGVLFAPMDSYRRDRLAMISVSDNLEKALTQFGSTLKILHKEVSTPNMTGICNFQSVIKEIEQILGQVIENSMDQKKEVEKNQQQKSHQQQSQENNPSKRQIQQSHEHLRRK
ncbi:IQ domain-containing protein H [Schistosoma japonicum]|nr:IQ domain-containing protein H [Schistosoma japonicum]